MVEENSTAYEDTWIEFDRLNDLINEIIANPVAHPDNIHRIARVPENIAANFAPNKVTISGAAIRGLEAFGPRLGERAKAYFDKRDDKTRDALRGELVKFRKVVDEVLRTLTYRPAAVGARRKTRKSKKGTRRRCIFA